MLQRKLHQSTQNGKASERKNLQGVFLDFLGVTRQPVPHGHHMNQREERANARDEREVLVSGRHRWTNLNRFFDPEM